MFKPTKRDFYILKNALQECNPVAVLLNVSFALLS